MIPRRSDGICAVSDPRYNHVVGTRFMRRLGRLLPLAILIAPLPTVARAAAPPLEAYGQLPACEMAAISESGDRYAFVGIVDDTRRLIVANKDDKPLFTIGLGDVKVRSIAFVGDDNVQVEISDTEGLGPEFLRSSYELFKVGSVDLRQGTMAWLMVRKPSLGVIAGNYGRRQIDGHWYGFFSGFTTDVSRDQSTHWRDGRPDLYRVDMANGTQRLIDEITADTLHRSWVIGPDGTIAAVLDEDPLRGTWEIRNQRTGATLASGKDIRLRTGLLGFGPTGDGIVYRPVDDTGGEHLMEVPLAGGTPRELLADVDVRNAITDRENSSVIGYVVEGDSPQEHFFDPRAENRMKAVRRAFPGLNVRLQDWSKTFATLLVETTGNGDSGTWWIVDMSTGKARNIAASYPGVAPDAVGPISMVAYKAGDGLDLHAVLTLPPGAGSARSLPLVVLPHGGPQARDYPDFDWWAQAFAARGYAVLQPNFRGSTGYGKAFEDAGNGEWGGKMQSDIADGIDALAAKGLVDPKRVCIVGASYGGYAALAGMTLQPGRYRCAVSFAGITDLPELYAYDRTGQSYLGGVRARWQERIGTRRALPDISPARHADAVTGPILLVHGKDDTVVPIQQSRIMEDALRKAGKPVETVVLKGEDHWLSRSETRLALLTASVAFVEKNNPPD